MYGPGAYAIEGPHLEDAPVEDMMLEHNNNSESNSVEEIVTAEARIQAATAEKTPPPQRKKQRLLLTLALVAIFAIAVIVGVMVWSGSDDTPRSAFTVSPIAIAPTIAPTADLWAECFGDPLRGLDRLGTAMVSRRDFDNYVEIEICSESYTPVALVDPIDWSRPLFGDLIPMNLQSNTRIYCGTGGTLAERCVISGWENVADALVINAFETSREIAARNVTIEGITFEDSPRNILRLYNGGDIVFRNCLFRVSCGSFEV